MHMYRVIQTGSRGLDTIVSLHGMAEDADDYVALLDSGNDGPFTYWVDREPVEVNVTTIEHEEN